MQVLVDLEAPEHVSRAIDSWNGTVMTTKAGMFTITVQVIKRAFGQNSRLFHPTGATNLVMKY